MIPMLFGDDLLKKKQAETAFVSNRKMSRDLPFSPLICTALAILEVRLTTLGKLRQRQHLEGWGLLSFCL